MLKKSLIITGIILGLAAIISIGHYADLFNSGKAQLKFKTDYQDFSLDIPADLNFAGEEVPIADFESRTLLDQQLKINSYNSTKSLTIHKKAYRWFSLIEPILKRHNIPDDFKYVALVESGFELKPSPKGASGYWQFIEPTALSYGLVINDEIDERNNIEKSTIAACKYFNDAYKILNSWTLVAASYNMGIGGIQKQIKSQKVTNYYNLLLNKETAIYLYKILAVKEVISRPGNYGYRIKKEKMPKAPATYNLVLDSSNIDLVTFAYKHNTSFKAIQECNPWIKDCYLRNPEKQKIIIQLYKPLTMEKAKIKDSLKQKDTLKAVKLKMTSSDHK